MLQKNQCILAINSWEVERSNYSTIEKLFPTSSCFHFSKDDCSWINDNNHYVNFHTYIGINNSKIILIVVPLNASGQEIPLDSYLTLPLTPLTKELTLIETDITTTTKKTTLSAESEIINHSEEIKFSTYNSPTITESATITDIIKWKNNFLNWFYFESNNFNGQRIFKTFTVPFSDLIKDNSDYDEVFALFGFKDSIIHQREIPVLIFVAAKSQKQSAKIIRSPFMPNSSLQTNTKDYSTPCPPMCRLEKNFNLLS